MAKIPDDTGGLKIISREAGLPAIDLTSLTLPLTVLDPISEELARARQVLPLRVDEDRLFVAVVRPDKATVDELAFITQRKVVAYAAHPDQLHDAINSAYAARRRGLKIWRGARAGTRADGSVEGALRIDPVTPPPPVREPFASDVPYRAPDASARARRSRPCILVVDDEPVIRRLIAEALAVRGYEVQQAGGGGEAFRLVKEYEPDVILLDAMMPDIHGFEVCRRLRGSLRYRDVPVIMITAVYKGWRMAADLKDAYGVFATVEKPFDLHHVVRLIGQALEGRANSDLPSAEVLSSESHRLFQEAADAYRGGDLDVAAERLTSAIAIDPLSAALHHQLGLVQARRGNDFAAIQELESAVDLEPHRFQTLRNLAVLYQKHGFRRKACEVWERTLAHAPDEATRVEIKKVLVHLL